METTAATHPAPVPLITCFWVMLQLGSHFSHVLGTSCCSCLSNSPKPYMAFSLQKDIQLPSLGTEVTGFSRGKDTKPASIHTRVSSFPILCCHQVEVCFPTSYCCKPAASPCGEVNPNAFGHAGKAHRNPERWKEAWEYQQGCEMLLLNDLHSTSPKHLPCKPHPRRAMV